MNPMNPMNPMNQTGPGPGGNDKGKEVYGRLDKSPRPCFFVSLGGDPCLVADSLTIALNWYFDRANRENKIDLFVANMVLGTCLWV